MIHRRMGPLIGSGNHSPRQQHHRNPTGASASTRTRAIGSEQDFADEHAAVESEIGPTEAIPPREHFHEHASTAVEEISGIVSRTGDGEQRQYCPRKRRLAGKIFAVAMAGITTLLVANERLTNMLGSPAMSLPLPFRDVTAAPRAWAAVVAGCTGPKDGYVYGGETGNVLTFVRQGRGVGGGGAVADHPSLPEVLRWFWSLKHDRGVLAYKVAELDTRRDVGRETGWGVVFASNVGRHKPFPKASPAEAPWNPSAFNFYKASPLEFMLSYTPSFRYEREAASPVAAAVAAGRRRRAEESGAVSREVDSAAGVGLESGRAASLAATMGEGKTARSQVALSGDGGERDLQMVRGGVPSAVGCGEASTASPPQDVVLVNIRPVGPVSLLLTPGYPNSHNQRAAADSLAVAMDFAEALMVDPGFRLGFNSAGSSASVNHLHFQCWYFDAGPGGLAIESSNSKHLTTVPLRRSAPATGKRVRGGSAAAAGGAAAEGDDSLEVRTLVGYPIRTVVFDTLGKDLEAVGEVIEKCVNFLVEHNTPHTMVFSTGRAFLLPRQHLEEPPFAVVPGFPEVSGEIIVTKEKDFHTITADQIYEWWRDKIGVNAEHFDLITNGCLNY